VAEECEYEVFQTVEEAFFLPKIKGGFVSIKDFHSLDDGVCG
jgi:hypothetical protein